jgi:hypothetical protein
VSLGGDGFASVNKIEIDWFLVLQPTCCGLGNEISLWKENNLLKTMAHKLDRASEAPGKLVKPDCWEMP